MKKLQIDDGLIEDLGLALSETDNAMEILPELCKVVRPNYGRFWDSVDGLIAERRDAGRHITKRRRLPTRRSPREKEEGLDASEDEKEGDESDGEEDGDGDKESEDREVLERGVEDETKEADDPDADHDTNAETGPDPDSGYNDDPGSSTELDSDSDFNFECTFNLRRSRFALSA